MLTIVVLLGYVHHASRMSSDLTTELFFQVNISIENTTARNAEIKEQHIVTATVNLNKEGIRTLEEKGKALLQESSEESTLGTHEATFLPVHKAFFNGDLVKKIRFRQETRFDGFEIKKAAVIKDQYLSNFLLVKVNNQTKTIRRLFQEI